MNLADMRKQYSTVGITREELLDDPVEQFRRWFDQACESGIPEPNAMSLATVWPDGRPLLRTVLLKQYDERGFVFFTNLESRKARQLADNAHAALLFPWVALERQVSIVGRAERVSLAEAAAYFVTRPVGSQLAAWASPQSRPISSRALLEAKWAEIKRKFADGKIPLPSFWGGYRVVPDEIEFWQGRANRMHDRFQYTRQPSGGWTIERLAP
jgi:pyridoxamine 5'-phosphate oxidase